MSLSTLSAEIASLEKLKLDESRNNPYDKRDVGGATWFDDVHFLFKVVSEFCILTAVYASMHQ